MPYFLNKNIDQLITANSNGDGFSILLKWPTAYPVNKNYKILYNIYMSSGIAPDFSNFFFDNPAFISIDGARKVNIDDLTPGDMYHFGVRAAEYDPNIFDPKTLPDTFNSLKVLPQSLLRANITATDTTIPLIDAEQFPSSGTVKIGSELIFYSTADYINNNLLVPSASSFNSHLVDQGGGHFYLPSSSNIGTGVINNLTLVSTNTPAQTWIIKCISTTTETQFESIGSISGAWPAAPLSFPNPPLWNVYNHIVSNGILSFSIQQTIPFVLGDSFIIKVAGSSVLTGGRGYNNTTATIHNTDGYDGNVFWTPGVIFWPIDQEDSNTRVYECWNRFDVNNFPFTLTDGYHQKTKDILTTDLTCSDAINTGFPAYDYAGYHRTDPVMLLSGGCVGSYIGGDMFCVDGYEGVGRQIRGLPIQDINMQRQEVLLSTTGEPVCLIQRNWTGITCDCMLPYNEYPEARCNKCLGSGLVVGWTQFFDPRRSDGKIMVRFDPAVDDLKATDSGLESEMLPTCWTLPVPSLKDRDIIVRFDECGNEEFRYEILNVTRNKLLLDNTGVQKFAVQRVRKTDSIYLIRIFRDTSLFPSVIYTSISSSLGIPVHNHSLVINEKIQSISQINQITSVSAGHSHSISNGIFDNNNDLGHIHTLILP